MDIYKAFEYDYKIIVNYDGYNEKTTNDVIISIDKEDFEQPFETDGRGYPDFDDINYVKINGKIYNDITLDLYADEIVEYSKKYLVDIFTSDIYEGIELDKIENGLVYSTYNGVFDLKDIDIRLCCSSYIDSKNINILYRD